MWGNVGYRHSTYFRFMNLVGFTYGEHNPDSWEGWHWGATHMWGFSHRLGIPEQYDLLEDALKNTEMIVFWSADPEASCSGVYAAFESTPAGAGSRSSGSRWSFIDPYFNHTAGLLGDKWFAPRLGTDVAMALAIAYTWLTEGTYDKEYIAEPHHRLRRVEGLRARRDATACRRRRSGPRPRSGIPAREIRALAREWAVQEDHAGRRRHSAAWAAPAAASWGNEWARAMVALAAMQGMGKPGSNIWGTTSGTPVDCTFMFPGYAEGGISGDVDNSAAGFRLVYRMFPKGGATRNPHHSTEGQTVARLRIPEAMRHENLEWRGKGFCGSLHREPVPEVRVPGSGLPARRRCTTATAARSSAP